MEWVIIQPLHFLAPLWQIPLGKRPAKLSSEDPSGQRGWTKYLKDTLWRVWDQWWMLHGRNEGSHACPSNQYERKQAIAFYSYLLWSRRNNPILSHTHTPSVYAGVCVFNLLPLQGQIAGFQPGRGLYLENSWNILESKPNVGQFTILYVTSFKIL